MKVRNLLELLDATSLNRLLDRRGLPKGGTNHEKCKRLAHSYKGRFDQLIDECTRDELKTFLGSNFDGELEAEGVLFRLVGLSNASLSDLRAAATEIVLRDWWPEDNEGVPGTSGRIRAKVLASAELYDDDDEYEDDGDDEDSDEGYEEDDDDDDDSAGAPGLASFTGASYADAFWKELAFAPERVVPLREHQAAAQRTLLERLTRDRDTPQLLHIATGGGKTLVANEIVKEYLGLYGGPVLWVTKDWRLLKQAAIDLCTRESGLCNRVGRVGGDQKDLAPLPPSPREGVVYTTLHTFLSRWTWIARKLEPKLVVWDECHWGEEAKTGRRVLRFCRERNVPVLGLTATPRKPDRTDFAVAYSKTFAELVTEGWLARPQLLAPVKTGVEWSPKIHGHLADFAGESLGELARSKKRNQLIVGHYVANADQYQKTLLFACNIDHAEALAKLFWEWPGGGVPARPVHSGMAPPEVAKALADFKQGAVQVLISIGMLTTGIDVPDARTIFLCRPTTSDILFAQMIGRGSRRHEQTGKASFNIVEFTDSLSKFQDQLMSAKAFFLGAGGGGLAAGSTSPAFRPSARTRPHRFDPTGAPTWIPDDDTVRDPLRGLWFRKGQTFGVEFELTSADYREGDPDAAWLRKAESLRSHLSSRMPKVASRVFADPGEVSDDSVWNVTFDRSAGWEVTSRILQDREGFEELADACEHLASAAHELDLYVNYRTGLHIHIGWLGRDVDEVKRAIQLAKRFEPAVATLVSPSRLRAFNGAGYDLAHPNEYCRPVAEIFSAQTLSRATTFDQLWRAIGQDKYVTFNVAPLQSQHTIEVRLHNGTLDSSKVLLWLSLWQQVLWAAAQHVEIGDVSDVDFLEPKGDIVALAMRYLPPVQQARFLERLDARRREVAELWAQHPSLESWMTYRKTWQRPGTTSRH